MVKFLMGCRGVLAMLLLAAAGAAFGQSIDPTRPPTALMPEAALSAPRYTGPVLQSVLVSQGRKIAMISGKEVRENEYYNGARVVRIRETEVVLRRGKQVQVLKLFPDVHKQAVQRATDKPVQR